MSLIVYTKGLKMIGEVELMKLKKCQKCGNSSDIRKMYVNVLEQPQSYLDEHGEAFERFLEILCFKCVNKSSFNKLGEDNK